MSRLNVIQIHRRGIFDVILDYTEIGKNSNFVCQNNETTIVDTNIASYKDNDLLIRRTFGSHVDIRFYFSCIINSPIDIFNLFR